MRLLIDGRPWCCRWWRYEVSLVGDAIVSPMPWTRPQGRTKDELEGKNGIERWDAGKNAENNCVWEDFVKLFHPENSADRRPSPCKVSAVWITFRAWNKAWCDAGSRCDSTRRINVLLVICKVFKEALRHEGVLDP